MEKNAFETHMMQPYCAHGCASKSMRMRFLARVNEGAVNSMRMRFLVGVTEGAHGTENAAENTPPHPEPKK